MPLLSNMRRTGGRPALRLLLIATAVALVACGGGDGGDPDVAEGPAPEAGAGTLSMGGGALGDQSTTTPVAQGLLDAQPGATVAWTAFTIELGDGDAVEGSGDAGFLYVVAGRIDVEWGDQERSLGPEEGVLVNAGVPFELRARDGPATVWDIRLRPPADEAAPDYAPAATFAWRSDPLQDIPPLPLAVMAIVTVPPGGQTIVHTHPGPEFIVVTSGRIDYQNAFKQAPGVGVGTTESIGPGVQVQKRNPYDEDGVFLSLFLVDAGQPFASAARFDGGDGGGSPEANLASLDNGARVVAVSSAFGGAALDEPLGRRGRHRRRPHHAVVVGRRRRRRLDRDRAGRAGGGRADRLLDPHDGHVGGDPQLPGRQRRRRDARPLRARRPRRHVLLRRRLHDPAPALRGRRDERRQHRRRRDRGLRGGVILASCRAGGVAAVHRDGRRAH